MTYDKIHYASANLREVRYNIARNELRKVTPKEEVKKFNEATLFQIIGDEIDEEEMTNFFDLFNYLSFAGFDYYHYSPIGDMLNEKESIIGTSSTIDVLINKDQLLKLKKVVSCFPDLKFISSKEDGGKQNYSIWYKDTPSRIDLIPFTRKGDNIVIELPTLDKDYSETLSVDENVHNNIPYKALATASATSQKEETILMKKTLRR